MARRQGELKWSHACQQPAVPAALQVQKMLDKFEPDGKLRGGGPSSMLKQPRMRIAGRRVGSGQCLQCQGPI